MNPFRTLLLGATSQIGVFAIPRLVRHGETALALSRKARPPARPRWPNIAWTQPQGINLNRAEDVTHLLSCGPLTLASHWLQRCVNVEHVVAFSTTSVVTKLDSEDQAERKQVEDILAEEQALKAQCAGRGIRLGLLRPTLIYGCGLDQNVSRVASLARAVGFVPVLAAAEGLRQPVHAADLADVAVRMLFSHDLPGGTWNLAGGATLSYPAMVERIFIALERRPRILPLPGWLLTPAASIAAWLPGLRGLRPAMIRRQAVDLVVDDDRARRQLAWAPRPFRPEASDLAFPSAGELRRLAGDSGH